MPLLSREELLRALRALDEELGKVGIRGEVFVVGGAAMALAYDVRRSTVDVDAIFAPSAEVRKASRAVSDRLGLGVAWLNDAAKAFLPGDDPDRVGVYEGPPSERCCCLPPISPCNEAACCASRTRH